MTICRLWRKMRTPRNSVFRVSLGLFMCILGAMHTASLANTLPTKHYYNATYEECIEREGGISNGSIAACTSIVISEVIVKIDDRVQFMLDSNNSYIEMTGELKIYDQQRKESFVHAINDFQESTMQICRFLGYHIGGPADPICTMDLMVDLLGMIDRWD